MEDNKVTIQTLSATRDGCDVRETYAYLVNQRGLQHGYFKINDYDSADQAWAAALALSDSLEQHPWVSPFHTYRSLILDNYGTTAKLGRVVMGLWNGTAYPFDLSEISE